MTYATFIIDNSTTYHVVADNTTVTSLVSSINEKCSSFFTPGNSTLATTTRPDMITSYNASAPNATKPENAIQYYRASSVVLTLDGYNNSAVFTNDTNAPDTPLPTTLNTSALDCLNKTIGDSVPLVDPSSSFSGGSTGNGSIQTMSPGLPGMIALLAVLVHLATS